MAKQLTGDELNSFKKDLTELNRLRRELDKKPLTFSADTDSIEKVNDLLDYTRGIVNDLDASVTGLSVQWRNVLGEVKKTNEAQKLGIGSLNKLKDLSDKLRLAQKGISELSSRELRSIQRKTKAEYENLQLTRDMLKASGENADLLAEIEDQIKNNTSAYRTQLDVAKLMEKQQKRIEKATGLTGAILKNTQGFLDKMGMSGLGGVFEEASEAANDMAKKVTKGGTQSAGLIGKVKTLGAAFKVVGKEIARNLLDPLVLAGGAFALLKKTISFVTKKYDEGKQAAERISEENTQMARSLGLAQGAASKLASSVAGMGPTVAASKQSVTALYQAMGSTEKLSANTLKVFVKLNTFAGMSADSLAKFQAFAKLSGQEAGTMVTNMANTALQVIKTNKLAISQKKLLEDTAAQSNTIKLQFRAQPQELLKAVAQSKKLGLELSKVEDIANGLLNIEDSIAAEMEAELLTGKDLNLEKAREAALNNDSKTLMAEIAKNYGSIEEFGKLNRVQQDAFAKSIGMSRDGLSDMLGEAEKNKSAQGDLVDGQQDGLKAMMSSVSEAEKNAEIDRRKQEASIKYYTELAPLVQTLSDIWTKIQGTLNSLFNDLVLKPMIEWVNGPAGKSFIDSLPEKAEKFAQAIRDGATALGEGVTKITAFIKDNPWLSAIAGTVTTGAIALGIKGLQALKGTKAMPLWVKIAGAGGGMMDMFKSKTTSGPKLDPKTGRYRDPATGKFTKAPSPSGGAGGGGGFFSRMGSKIADSKLGKAVSSTASKVSGAASKALDFANPMTYIKKYMPKIMDSKGFKKVVSSIPKIGNIASLAMIAYDLISQGAGIAAATKQGVGPQEIGKQIVMALGDLGGSVIGGALGSLIPVPGVGTLLGTFLGGLGGSALAGLIADNTDVSGIGNWAIKALGNPQSGGSAEDFILQDGKMTKFRKDDVIVGGTNLGGGDNGKTIQLLERLVAAVEKGGVVTIDGQKVGQALVLGSYRTQ